MGSQSNERPSPIRWVSKQACDIILLLTVHISHSANDNFNTIGLPSGSANENVKVSNVKLQLSGGQTRSYSKLPYKFDFPKGHALLDIGQLKLRSAETDPTMIREKLYIDLLNTIGVPAPQASYVRLYFNQKPVGLYVAEEVMKEHWVTNILHSESVRKVKTANAGKFKTGSLWKMDADDGLKADLLWKGATTKSYKEEVGHIYKNLLPGSNPKNDEMRDLIKLMSDLKSFDPKTEKDPIGYWGKRLDLDVFLRAMAMEYLTGYWDGYWTSGSNYQMYNNPVTNLWTWLPIDYDDTFGSSYSGQIESYSKFRVKTESPLVQKLILESPQIRAHFEATLKDIVGYVFKPQALMPRVLAYKDMILNDVKWDRSLPRLNSKGESEDFDVEDLTRGVIGGKKGEWGLKAWIVKRTAGVEKDLNFKVLPGTPSKVEPHAMTNLQSPYGIVAKDEKSVAKDTKGDAVAKGDDTVDGGDIKVDDSIEKDTTSASGLQAEKTMNSAMSLSGEWSAFITALTLIVLTL